MDKADELEALAERYERLAVDHARMALLPSTMGNGISTEKAKTAFQIARDLRALAAVERGK